MKKEYTAEDTPKKSGRAFYIALAVCLVSVCGVAVSGFVTGLATDTDKTQGSTASRTTQTTTKAQQVVIPATDVKDDRTTTTTPTTATTPTTTTTADGMFVLPASNRVLCPFSDSLVYSETLEEWVTHNGVDFSAEQGSQVKVIAAGTVVRVYNDALWGDTVEVDHGGKVVSRYCGVKAAGIAEGQTVKMGQVIGTVTEIPAEVLMESHMHLEVLANDNYVDPLLLIRGETVNAAK